MTIITPTKKKGTQWDEQSAPRCNEGESEADAERRFFENNAAASAPFDYPDDDDSPSNAQALSVGLERVLTWINNGSNARAKEIRIQAVRYYLGHKNQVELAREVGVKKATISQQAVAFKDYFKLNRTAGASSAMRSEESRKTFSKACKSNHEKKKAKSSSESTGSQMTSTASSPRPSGLREKVLAAAMLPSSQPLSAAG